MEEDEIQAHASKFPRVGNIGSKIASSRVNNNNNNNEKQNQDEEEDVELRRRGGGGGSDRSTNRFHHHNSWNNHSSRIIRVPRASGGKDRHSKVMTSKGLRDRRVRLSVLTAIQFYDLQDRLGYDQPSKAVEWLIKAASDAISELPPLNNNFPETPRQLSDERSRPSLVVGNEREQGLFDEIDGDNDNNNNNYPQQNQSQNISMSKSACSSTSETSKGSGLSLSRSEIRVNRVKARERARKRAAAKEKEEKEKEKEKEKENESQININNSAHYHHHHNVNNSNPMSQTASFTELLTGGIGNNSSVTVPNTSNGDEVNLFHKAATTTRQQQQQQHWSSTVTPIMDYFSPGLLVGTPSSSRTTHHQSLIQLGTTSLPVSLPPFSGENNSDQMQQQFSFMHDHLIMPAAAVVTSSSPPQEGGDHYNLNFSISSNPSSGLAGYNNNRGTLQSNHHLSLLPHHLQRFSSLDGSSSNVPFFIGGATQASAAPNIDNNNNHHEQFPSSVFDGRLQLYYGDGTRHSDQKGKGKN